ncbi:Uncharacterised protein [Mycobacteroides abscessus subsp. abscessus]|nr:Uncharacterised protein [Mycobacteroides abscessus subsp. abscessus]
MLIGNTRTCSPGACRPLYRLHSSGRCFFGSHWPKALRRLKIRSLARERSSSRRPPPSTASNLLSVMASSSGIVCRGLRIPSGRSVRRPSAR